MSAPPSSKPCPPFFLSNMNKSTTSAAKPIRKRLSDAVIAAACLLSPCGTSFQYGSFAFSTKTPHYQRNMNGMNAPTAFTRKKHRTRLQNALDDEEYYSAEFDDIDNLGSLSSSQNEEQQPANDLSGCQSRQFTLGYDVLISSYAGSMGFDEVIDWDYFQSDADGTASQREYDRRNNMVEPPPFDPTKPKRTKSSSGSVIRLFLGEICGKLSSRLRSLGMDNRVLIKEFRGSIATELARRELDAVGKLQGNLCGMYDAFDGEVNRGDWRNSAATRCIMAQVHQNTKEDDGNLIKLMKLDGDESHRWVGVLGGLNLSDLFEDTNEAAIDRQDWYRALKVSPPKPDSVFVVYQYSGLSTAANYAQPPSLRRAALPVQKTLFGGVKSPPPLPPWNDRANYVTKGVLRGILEAVATLHENGIAHRSIGRNSIILSSVGQDKTEASSIYATAVSRLSIKLSDFGFSGLIQDSPNDDEFRSRARGFGIEGILENNSNKGPSSSSLSTIKATNFAMAEDLHAVGFVFLGILLTTLAEPPTSNFNMPSTDEDQLQRLLGEIFKKDMEEFRDYCEAEEVWDNVVELLDKKNGAGWDLIESLCFARERASEIQGSPTMVTARALLSSPFFND
mmetsp:Transcript_33823/g.49723  ORF Transcript_33823/g.49723 Transcript_33823/m.49723 type:complete len:622 (+) Transcript_33823:62-1927(+)